MMKHVTITRWVFAHCQVIVAEAVPVGALRPILSLWWTLSVPVNAVFASVRYLTPKVRAFIDLAVDAMRNK
jgi:DNA-binding transcriptional LysR family regulator